MTGIEARAPWRQWAGIWALYLALALAYCWPLLRSFSTALPNDTGDPGLVTYLIWWNAEATPFTAAWWNVPIFFPERDVLVFSDHMLGVAPLTTPLLWAGVPPVAVHNVLFVVAIVTAAVAAHALAHHLTGRHDVAVIAGLAFGFNPYRASQMPHVQLLVTAWLPLMVFALHRYLRDRRTADLALLGLAWLMNGLTSGYYLIYFGVLAGLWMLWFLRDRRAWLAVSSTLVAASLPLVPILLRYSATQRAYGLSRGRGEIESFSADLTAFLAAAPQAWLPFHWTLPARPEGELFPGLAVVLLTATAAITAWRRLPTPALGRVRRGLFGAAAVVLAAAAISAISGGWRLNLGGLVVAMERPHRVVTVGIWLLAAAVATDPRLADAWRRRSTFAFYGLAAVVTAILALGPVARVADVRFWHNAPYTVFALLPGFGGLRVPARFGMLVVLCLATAAALALARWRRPGVRPWMPAALALAVLADGWVPRLPIAPVGVLADLPELESGAVVLELPVRDLYSDTAAMLNATVHRRPLINGFSGYGAAHYDALMVGLRGHDPSAFDALRRLAPLAVLVTSREGDDGTEEAFVRQAPGARLLARTPRGPLYVFTRLDAPPTRGLRPVPIRGVVGVDESGARDVTAALTDGALATAWDTSTPQAIGHRLEVTLSEAVTVARLELDLAAASTNYPRRLRIRTGDGTVVWEGGAAGPAVTGILRDRVRKPVGFDLTPAAPTANLLIELTAADAQFHWSVMEMRLLGH